MKKLINFNYSKDNIYLILSFIIIGYFILSSDSVCILKNFFGIPCPFCGFTRSYLYALKGDFRNAIHFHPLFLLPPICTIIYFVKRELFKNKYFIIFIVVIFLLVYIIRMKLYFPNTEPMTFNYDSWCNKIFILLKRGE